MLSCLVLDKKLDQSIKKRVLQQLTICKSQRNFVSAGAAILKEVGPNLIQSSCCCTVVGWSFRRTSKFCKNWEILDSLSSDAWRSLSIAMVGNKKT